MLCPSSLFYFTSVSVPLLLAWWRYCSETTKRIQCIQRGKAERCASLKVSVFFNYRLLKTILQSVNLTLSLVFMNFVVLRLMATIYMQAEINRGEGTGLTTSFTEWDYGTCDKDLITIIISMSSFCNSFCAWGYRMQTSHANLQFVMFKHKSSETLASSFTCPRQ